MSQRILQESDFWGQSMSGSGAPPLVRISIFHEGQTLTEAKEITHDEFQNYVLIRDANPPLVGIRKDV